VNLWIGVMLGGAVGSALRYGVSVMMGAKLGPDFPYGTLTVNVAGCLLIGLLGVLLAGPWWGREEVRLAILVGGLGGFTTFSSFGADALGLIEQGRWTAALVYVSITNIAGLIAVWTGDRLGRLVG
jgi:CrcB protein